MEDIKLNVDGALANIEMEIPMINYLRTPSKSQCNGKNLNDFMARRNPKLFPSLMTYIIKH